MTAAEAVSPTAFAPSEAQPAEPRILGLPPPPPRQPGEAGNVLDVSTGNTISLDVLGPVVVNEDGTLARIANWHAMTDEERRTTQRVLSARNNARLARLRAAKAEPEALD